ncbi:MAG: carboxymethylenebutenolidase [Moraxellaceae bacterium]|nr:MAG: carboxymethylenebutenolidase [Moraxellaceae bacterium]
MGIIQIKAADGHTYSAYEAAPSSEVKGCIVLIQEIFGVNEHIRSVADGYAEEGFYVIAPALFDRVETEVELGYDGSGMQKGIQLVTKLDPKNTLGDIAAATSVAKEKHAESKIAIMGYCFGGAMAWLSAATLDDFSCAVCYYGGQIASMADRTPKCPTLLHFGENDPHIPLSDVDKIREAQPDVEIFVYDGAHHGFNCDARSDFHEGSASIAKRRSLEYFEKYL